MGRENMGRFVFFVLAALASVGYADIPDVTSIYRLRETGVGDDFVTFDECFGGSNSCPWDKTGWEVKSSSDSEVRSIARIHALDETEAGRFIPLESNLSVSLSIKPTFPEHLVLVYLMEKPGAVKEIMLALYSDGNHRVVECQKMQVAEDLDEGQHFPCTNISGWILNKDEEEVQSAASYVYQVDYNPETRNVTVDKITGDVSERLIQSVNGVPVDARYMRIISMEGESTYTISREGLLLKDLQGELVSRDIAVTPTASRLCLSIASDRHALSTSLNVSIRAKDGRTIDFQNASAVGIDHSHEGYQVNSWDFVADLKDFQNQTVDIQIQASSHQKGQLYITGISRCKEIGGSYHMTLIHQTASLEVHANAAGDEAPFMLPNNQVIGANVGVPNGCMPVRDGCRDWSGIGTRGNDDWSRKAGNSRLKIGAGRFSESLMNAMSPSRDFVDAVQVSLHDTGKAGAKYRPLRDYFRVVLLDKENQVTDGTIYVLAVGLDDNKKPEKPVLYKCGGNVGTESVMLTLSVTRQDCKKLAEGRVPSFTLDTADEFKLQVFVGRQGDGHDGQEIKVKYYGIIDKDAKLLLSHTDPSPSKVANYILSSATKDYVYATSQGVGSLHFSLDSSTAVVNSPWFPVPETGNVCLALDYRVDGKNDVDLFTVKAVGSGGDEVHLKRSNNESEADKWVHEKVTGKIGLLGGDVKLSIAFKKPAGQFLLQRLAFCHREDDTALIYAHPLESRPVSIFHPGARFAVQVDDDDSDDTALCQNGGEHQTGLGCDCPAGFMGRHCEKACGPNRYGANCESICSFTTRGCRGMLMGRPYLGFNCAPGFAGPLCDLPCEAGINYGAGCLQKCGKCAVNTTCDVYTGECLHGCQPGLMPPTCKQEFVYLTRPLALKRVTKNSADFEVDFRNQTGGSGKYWWIQYKLKGASGEWVGGDKKNISEDETTARATLQDLVPGTSYLARVVLLTKEAGWNYQGEKIPVTSFSTECDELKSAEYKLTASPLPKAGGLHITWQYAAGDVGTCSVTAFEVQVRGGWRWNVYRFPVDVLPRPEANITDLLPGITYRVRVRALTASHATAPFSAIARATVGGSTSPSHVVNLRVKSTLGGNEVSALWDEPRFTPKNSIKYYNVTFQCISLLACPDLACDANVVQRTVVSMAANVKFEMLAAHARYRILVRPIGRAGEDSAELLPGPEASVVFETPSTNTTAEATWVEQNPAQNSETSVSVSWARPDADNCREMNGALLGYRCEISPKPDGSGAVSGLDTRNTYVTFTGLAASTDYTVKVFVRTAAGINTSKFIKIEAKTHAPSPGVVKHLTVYSKSSSMLGLRWRPPTWQDEDEDYPDEVPDVDIDHYVVEYVASNGDGGNVKTRNVTMDEKCTAWPDQFCHKISRLAKDTDYRVTVYALSADGKKGKQGYTKGVTTEKAPDAPSNLVMKGSTETSITLRWDIPERINGVLKRFQIVAERITDDGVGVEEFDEFKSVANEGETASYEYTVEPLTAHSKYQISVMAMTKEKGVPVKGTFSTKRNDDLS